MSHTPGPWKVLRPSTGVDANWHVTDSADTFVAHVFGYCHAVDEQSRINAQLIAAAPDLLDALRGMVAYANKYAFMGSTDGLREIARSAIAKATGEQT